MKVFGREMCFEIEVWREILVWICERKGRVRGNDLRVEWGNDIFKIGKCIDGNYICWEEGRIFEVIGYWKRRYEKKDYWWKRRDLNLSRKWVSIKVYVWKDELRWCFLILWKRCVDI